MEFNGLVNYTRQFTLCGAYTLTSSYTLVLVKALNSGRSGRKYA